MNVIIAYLETMFSTYPQTPRLLEAKTELHSMMEDAYTGLIAEGRSENEAVGQVIRDFGNLEEVAPVLGIASDIAPARPVDSPQEAPDRSHPPVTLEEAQAYADAQKRVRFRVSTAVMLFVVSPIVLIVLPVAATSGLLPLTDAVGVFIGLLVLLVLAAIGVALIVAASREVAPYSRITEARFVVDPVVTRWAEALSQKNERRRIRALQIAIALWIFAPLPLIAFVLFLGDSPRGDVWTVLGVALVLAIVALGLGLLLPQRWAHTVADQLGRRSEGDAGDDENGLVGVIAAFYWPLLTAIFLAWIFICNAWNISWVVWPVGGVLFGAIASGASALEDYRKARR